MKLGNKIATAGLFVSLLSQNALSEVKHTSNLEIDSRIIVSEEPGYTAPKFFFDWIYFAHRVESGKVTAGLGFKAFGYGSNPIRQDAYVSYKTDEMGSLTFGSFNLTGDTYQDVQGVRYNYGLLKGENPLNVTVDILDSLSDEDANSYSGSAAALTLDGSFSGISYKVIYGKDENYIQNVSSLNYVTDYTYQYVMAKTPLPHGFSAKVWYEGIATGDRSTFSLNNVTKEVTKNVSVSNTAETKTVTSLEIDHVCTEPSETGAFVYGLHLDALTYDLDEDNNHNLVAAYVGMNFKDGLKTKLWVESYEAASKKYEDKDGEMTDKKMVIYLQNYIYF